MSGRTLFDSRSLGRGDMVTRLTRRRVRLAYRWRFLEDERDACSVVTRRMEVVYLNAAARALVPSEWFGSRCWEVFPVGDESCAARCAAVSAVSKADELIYCEETLHAADGSPIPLGVAVIPLHSAVLEGERALLLLRPKTHGRSADRFRRDLLEEAGRLLSFCDSLPRPRHSVR